MFCSYNFVLIKVPNNNDIKHIANIVLNEAPNSNDAMHIGINARLTAKWVHNNSQWQLCSHHAEKPTY